MFRFLFVVAAMIWAQGAGAQDDYVGSATCAACHTDAAEAWAGSHHAQAWTEATPDTILGDFDGVVFTLGEMTARFDRDGADYFVTVTETDGQTTRHKVHSLGGVHPLQQLLIETGPGQIQSFDVVWDVEGAAWYHLYPEQDLPPSEALHWTGPYKSWTARCAECHATGFSRNYDPIAQSYAPQMSEIGVGCEACHGPGQVHVDWAQSGADASAGYGFSATLADRDAVLGQCAGCHSRREAQGDGNPLPGTAFDDAYRLALLREGLYHPDGQILDEVYVHGSFLQSKMYAAGVGCLNCHEAHSGERVAEGNAVCTQCHSEAGNPDFPTLRVALYDDPSHHFHSEGAQCVDCHMIERDYMGVDGRRDHSFRVPRPDLGSKIGAPDACTDCHSDQTQDWAAAEIAARFPDSAHRGPHFGEVISAGRQDARAASGALAALALDRDQPGIARATAAYLLQRAALTPAEVARLDPLLRDPDPLVRREATALQSARPEREQVGRLVPLLSDPVATVRMAAARGLLRSSPGAVRGPAAERLTQAFAEWQRSLQSRLDYPETHLVLGGMALSFRNLEAAEAAFAEATRQDPQRAEAWVMRVRIALAAGDRARAGQIAADALIRVPDDPNLRQMAEELGL